MVTHALDCLPFIDRIVMLEKGQIVFDGLYSKLIESDSYKVFLSHVNQQKQHEGDSQSADDDKPEEPK